MNPAKRKKLMNLSITSLNKVAATVPAVVEKVETKVAPQPVEQEKEEVSTEVKEQEEVVEQENTEASKTKKKK